MPSSRYFSVAGPNDRSERSFASRIGLLRVGQRCEAIAPHGEGLHAFRSEDGTQTAPSGMPPVMADGRKGDELLARRSNHRDLPVGSKPLANSPLCLAR